MQLNFSKNLRPAIDKVYNELNGIEGHSSHSDHEILNYALRRPLENFDS